MPRSKENVWPIWLTALGFSWAADGFTSSSTLFRLLSLRVLLAAAAILSRTDRPLDDYANSALIAADVQLFFGCKISKWNERIVELTDKFGPLSGWPPLGVLFGEEGAGPVGGQRDAVHHQLVGVALGRILGHGRWQTFRFDEFRTSWRRSGRQQDHHHTEPDIGPHFCSNFSIFFRLQITICFGWNSSTPTGINHWINDWNS